MFYKDLEKEKKPSILLEGFGVYLLAYNSQHLPITGVS
jgi:hypothetical protein